jgi:hypothetical protein
MAARVFISYRSSDGADKATALARDLDELFGQEQIFLDKDDLPAGSRWRDEIARALGAAPILLVLVTPNYLGARDPRGTRCIDRDDDPVRAELASAIEARAHVIPMLCDGVAQTPTAAELPPPFDQLADRTWRRLRAYDWREDLARLSNDLRSLGVVPRTTPGPLGPGPLGSFGVSLGDPAGTDASGGLRSRNGRRLALGLAGLVALGGAGYALWQWQERKAASLAGQWRAHIGKRGASSSRDGEIVNVTIEQTGQKLRVASSAVDIRHDPEWQKYREFWQQRVGQPLERVFYRGEGDLQQDDTAPRDAPAGPRRVSLAVRVDPPEGGEPIDTGSLRGTIDADGTRIRCKLWLNSEQAERVVDLRRAP